MEAHILGLEGGFSLDPPVKLEADETLAIRSESGTPTRYDVIVKWDEKKVLRSGICKPRAALNTDVAS